MALFFCFLMRPVKDTLMPAASSKTDLGEIFSDITEKRLEISLGDGRTLKQIMEEDFFFMGEKCDSTNPPMDVRNRNR